MGRTTAQSRNGKAAAASMNGLPTSVRVLVFAMVAAAAGGVAVRFGEVSRWDGRDTLGLIVLTLATSIAEQFPLEIRHRTENLYLALTDSMWAAGLVLARPGVLTMAVAVGVYFGLLLRKVAPHKIAFNLGQYVLSITVAEVVFSALAGSATTAFKLLVAVPVAGFPWALLYGAYRIMGRNLREGDRLRGLIGENASDGIFVAAPDCSIVSWNPAMERITGQAADEVIGKNWRSILASSGSAEPPRGGTAPCQAPGDAWFAPIVRKDGTEGWILCSSSTVNGRDGKVKATVIVVHDISAEREAEQLKADFIATISHELRTPLTPLKGFLSSWEMVA